MTQLVPSVHHVVFAVSPERLARATEFLTALGFQLQELELENLGLQVRLDWDRGIELISPKPDAPHEPGSAAEFIAHNGDGLFSVVIRVADSDAGEQIASRYGTQSDFRQHFEGDGSVLREVKLRPTYGIPLTLLETNIE